MSYIFRCDDGSIVSVGFEKMMESQGGILTLDNGTVARRVYGDEPHPCRTDKQIKVQAEVVSDKLGVPKHAVNYEMARAEELGLRVEFKPDPHTPEFCNAHFASWRDRDRFAASLANPLVDKTSRNGGGQPLSPELLKRATERLLAE
jgi:hypothetical protein